MAVSVRERGFGNAEAATTREGSCLISFQLSASIMHVNYDVNTLASIFFICSFTELATDVSFGCVVGKLVCGC